MHDYNRLSWADSQREAYNKRTMTAERIQRLEEAGMLWDIVSEESWEVGYRAFGAYRKQYPYDMYIENANPKYRDYNLGTWIDYQSEDYTISLNGGEGEGHLYKTKFMSDRRTPMTNERVQRLKEVGIWWLKSTEELPKLKQLHYWWTQLSVQEQQEMESPEEPFSDKVQRRIDGSVSKSEYLYKGASHAAQQFNRLKQEFYEEKLSPEEKLSSGEKRVHSAIYKATKRLDIETKRLDKETERLQLEKEIYEIFYRIIPQFQQLDREIHEDKEFLRNELWEVLWQAKKNTFRRLEDALGANSKDSKDNTFRRLKEAFHKQNEVHDNYEDYHWRTEIHEFEETLQDWKELLSDESTDWKELLQTYFTDESITRSFFIYAELVALEEPLTPFTENAGKEPFSRFLELPVCSKCSKSNPVGSKYCIYCGSILKSVLSGRPFVIVLALTIIIGLLYALGEA